MDINYQTKSKSLNKIGKLPYGQSSGRQKGSPTGALTSCTYLLCFPYYFISFLNTQ
jgi:hypothetical protein